MLSRGLSRHNFRFSLRSSFSSRVASPPAPAMQLVASAAPPVLSRTETPPLRHRPHPATPVRWVGSQLKSLRRHIDVEFGEHSASLNAALNVGLAAKSGLEVLDAFDRFIEVIPRDGYTAAQVLTLSHLAKGVMSAKHASAGVASQSLAAQLEAHHKVFLREIILPFVSDELESVNNHEEMKQPV